MSTKKKHKLTITLSTTFPFISIKIVGDTKHPTKGEIDIGINWVMWFWFGLFLLLVSVLLEKFNTHFEGLLYTFNLLSGLSRDLAIAVISASLIAKIIEVPNFINFVNNRTIEALTNNDFLTSLGPNELTEIKKKCSKLIFEKNGKRTQDQFLNESLIEYDAEITKLLLQPYYEYYKINVHCEDIQLHDSDGNPHWFMKKTSKRNYKIVNPLVGSSQVDIIPPMNMHCPDKYIPDDLVILNKISVTPDGEKKIDITGTFSKATTPNGVSHPDYNTRVNYYITPNKNSIYPFNSEMIVELEETRFIAHSDPIYVQRVSKPAKNFSINYTYNNPKTTLKIEGFGADANLTDGKFIKTEGANSVSFEMLSWLLPGNGIIIATIPLEVPDKPAKMPVSTLVTPG